MMCYTPKAYPIMTASHGRFTPTRKKECVSAARTLPYVLLQSTDPSCKSQLVRFCHHDNDDDDDAVDDDVVVVVDDDDDCKGTPKHLAPYIQETMCACSRGRRSNSMGFDLWLSGGGAVVGEVSTIKVLLPRPPMYLPLRALWSLLASMWGILKGSWGVLVELSIVYVARHYPQAKPQPDVSKKSSRRLLALGTKTGSYRLGYLSKGEQLSAPY